eukprot:gene18604-20475_t
MDDFTQRLLEKKNARKRKQEEAAAALKNIELPSERKRSPLKSRNYLNEKNDVPRSSSKEQQKTPKPIPRSDLSTRRELESKHKFERERSGMQSTECLAKKPPKQERTPKKLQESKVSSNGGESIQERMSRLRNESNNFEDDLAENKKRRNAGQEDRMNSKIGKAKVDKSSGSVSERLAVFEQQKKSQSPYSDRHNSNTSTTDDYSPSYSHHHHHGASKVKKTSSRKYTSPITCSSRNDGTNSLVIDQSCSLDFDSDENPFDVSAILKEADAAEQRVCQQQAEYAKASWSVTDYLGGDSPSDIKNSTQISVDMIDSAEKQGRKRESVYSIDERGEEPSIFAKQIAKKQRAMKNSSQQAASISKLDEQLDIKSSKLVYDDVDYSTNMETRSSKCNEQHKRKAPNRPEEDFSAIAIEKRKAPQHPYEDISAIAVEEPVSNASHGKQKRKEEKKLPRQAQEKQMAPAKPARQSKDAKKSSGSKINIDSDVPVKKVKSVTDIAVDANHGKEDRKRRAREEENKKIIVDNAEVGGYAVQEKEIHGAKQESAKRQKHVEKAVKSGDNWHTDELVSVEEAERAPASVNSKDVMFSPNSKTYKSVREKKSTPKPKKTMRRSMSFSEGHPPPQIQKSGYNEEASSRYNVVTTCVPSKEQHQDDLNKSEKIKDLLDYAVSQQNIVIQASQALNMGLQGEDRRGSPEIVEGERLLLLATERRTACLNEVERLKHGGESASKMPSAGGGCQPCKANLSISEIKLPLNGDFLLALRAGRMDLGVFHFVVLIQYGPKQILSTKVRCTYDELSRNFLTFKEKIELKDVPHDFVLTIKVFGMHTKRGTDSNARGKKQQHTKDSPGLMKNVFSSLTPRRRVNSADDSPVRGSSPKPVFRTTSFTPCGITQVNLAMVKSGKHVLTKVPKNCPLDGFVEMNVDCHAQFTASARGFLAVHFCKVVAIVSNDYEVVLLETLLEEVGEYTAWNRRWCVMQGDAISFWRFPDEETSKPPVGSIDLINCITNCVDMVPRMDCSRPNTFELIVKKPIDKTSKPSLLSTIQGSEMHTKKLLIATSIVALRHFASNADAYSAALKQFYFAVHPDFFSQFPLEKETNENSLKLLNDYINEAKSKNDVRPVTVSFFLRKKLVDSEKLADSDGEFSHVKILLRSRHIPTLIHNILSQCHLPIQNELEKLVRFQKTQNTTKKSGKIKWSASLKEFMDEDVIDVENKNGMDTLFDWLARNINTARDKMEAVRPFVEDNRRIAQRMIRRHRLKSFICTNTGYSQVTLSGALKQLEYLYKKRTINTRGLEGKIVKFGSFNGLDQLGRFIIDITDVPTVWIKALVSLSDMDGLRHVLDFSEMQISEMLLGLRVTRSKKHEPVSVQFYYKNVTRLLQSLRESHDTDILMPPFLDEIRGKIASASSDLHIAEDGDVTIPCKATFDAILSFLRLNYPQINESRQNHARSTQAEIFSVKSCAERLKLLHLKKDQIISKEEMIKCCDRLKKENFLGLENVRLIISNYYGISGDAVLLRALLIAYGHWHDLNFEVKYTDIDYEVFSDAAEHVYNGNSPYKRATYRYTPLLAFIMLPNVWLHKYFGKVFFSICDLIVGVLIIKILSVEGGILCKETRRKDACLNIESRKTQFLALVLWLFNPLTLTISTRGNAESFQALLVLSTLLCILQKHHILGGFFYGLAVHFKIYPAIYSLPIILFMVKENIQKYKKISIRYLLFLIWDITKSSFTFVCTTLTTLVLAMLILYQWYGDEFIKETYLYHLTRKDIKHNFSPYFYVLYLTINSPASKLISLLAFIPQAVTVVAIGFKYHSRLSLACFLQTFAFVTFNKVCTSQCIWVWLFLRNNFQSLKRCVDSDECADLETCDHCLSSEGRVESLNVYEKLRLI